MAKRNGKHAQSVLSCVEDDGDGQARQPANIDLPRIERAVREILISIGEDPDREGLIRTPNRVARAYAELMAGLSEDPCMHLKTVFNERYDEVVIVSCEMALRMRTLSRIAAAHDVVRIEILSAYRTAPRSSFHTMGLGLDLFAFHQADGTVLSVLDDFVETPAETTCEASRPRGAAGTLLAIACDLAASHDFSSVLTPNYNDGHRNHFHLDCRPDDPRTFVR